MKNTEDDELFNSEQRDAEQGHHHQLNRTDLSQHGTVSYQTTRHAEICIDKAKKTFINESSFTQNERTADKHTWLPVKSRLESNNVIMRLQVSTFDLNQIFHYDFNFYIYAKIQYTVHQY